MRDPIAQLLLENIQPRPRRAGWHGGPTPVGAVRGVAREEAQWRPASGRKSIWDLVLHIAYWKYAVRRRLQGASGSNVPRFPRSPANWPVPVKAAGDGQWREDVALLRREHDLLLAVVAAIPSARYAEELPGGRRWTVGEMIVGIAQHDAYHTGQIQMLKRLWASSGSSRRKQKPPAGRRRAV